MLAYDYTVLAGTQGAMNHKKSTACSGSPSSRACRSCSSPRAAADGRATPTGSADRPRRAVLRAIRQALGPGAVDRHQLGPLLRRQRRDARLLRRHHRDREPRHRHGRPGDDRRRRPGRLSSGRGRADVGAGAERRRRHPRRRRGRGASAAAKSTFPISREPCATGKRRTSGSCAARSRRIACASTTSATSSTRSPTRGRCWSCVAISASA